MIFVSGRSRDVVNRIITGRRPMTTLVDPAVSRFPAAVQPIVQALPLTALNDALRLVYNEGSGVAAVAPEAAIMAAWTVVSFALAFRWFRWQ